MHGDVQLTLIYAYGVCVLASSPGSPPPLFLYIVRMRKATEGLHAHYKKRGGGEPGDEAMCVLQTNLVKKFDTVVADCTAHAHLCSRGESRSSRPLPN